jgi:hypothetical protein
MTCPKKVRWTGILPTREGIRSGQASAKKGECRVLLSEEHINYQDKVQHLGKARAETPKPPVAVSSREESPLEELCHVEFGV